MKEALYSLEDREYSFLMQRIGDVYKQLGISYALVGGAATQVRTVAMICAGEKKPLEDLILTEDVSERKNLRRTHDMDIITDGIKDNPFGIIEALSGEVATDNDIFTIELVRKGIKRPIYKISSLNGSASITFNISHIKEDMERLNAENYSHFLNEAEDVTFEYEELRPKIRVIKPEHIITAKLSRNVPRDQFDILTLVETSLGYGIPLDLDEIGECLGVLTGYPNPMVPAEYMDRFDRFKSDYEQRKLALKQKQ